MTKGLLYKGESLWYNKPAIRVEVLFREKRCREQPFCPKKGFMPFELEKTDFDLDFSKVVKKV